MLHSIVTPNAGRPVVHHFGDGAAVWGQAITASIGHLIQSHRAIALDYSLVGPGIVFETLSSAAMLPHVLDTARLRLHAEAAAFRRATNKSGAIVDAAIRCHLGVDCVLKLWGRVTTEEAIDSRSQSVRAGREAMVPLLFEVSFWEIRHCSDARMNSMIKVAAEKDRRISELEAKVALSMCSQ